MAVELPTASEIRNECSLKLGYFPRFDTDAQLDVHLRTVITKSSVFVRKRITTAVWNAASGDDAVLLHDCVFYLTCGYIWQQIKNVMDAYDEEDLPPEFVSPEQAAANRDFYLQQAESMISLVTVGTSELPGEGGGFSGPYLSSAGVSEGTPRMLQALLESV